MIILIYIDIQIFSTKGCSNSFDGREFEGIQSKREFFQSFSLFLSISLGRKKITEKQKQKIFQPRMK